MNKQTNKRPNIHPTLISLWEKNNNNNAKQNLKTFCAMKQHRRALYGVAEALGWLCMVAGKSASFMAQKASGHSFALFPLCCQPYTSGRREHPLKNCLCQTASGRACETLLWLMIDSRGFSPLWVVPSWLVRWFWVVQERWLSASRGNKLVSGAPSWLLLQAPASSSCCGFSLWWAVKCKMQ